MSRPRIKDKLAGRVNISLAAAQELIERQPWFDAWRLNQDSEIDDTKPENWIVGAFYWERSPEGVLFWCKANIDWQNKLKEYSNVII